MRRLAVVWLLVVLAGCGGQPSPGGSTPSASSSPRSPAESSSAPTSAASKRPSSGPPRVLGAAAHDLAVPWGVAFLPDGSALVTERDSGRVLQVRGSRVRTVGRVAESRAQGEAGLLGVAVSPSYGKDHRVFFYATTGEDNRVLRTTYESGRLGHLQPILTGIPHGFIHDGGRMVFGPDQMLYVSTGETGRPALAQDRSSLGGKILRITQDGDPAPGNPFGNSPVWTLGHRNVQGLAFDDAGNLWASEFGQDTWDELNLIRKGQNYGWPAVEGKGGGADYTDPQLQWPTDKASPSGLAFLDGRLWLGALRGERLWRVEVSGRRAHDPKAFFIGRYGRMRTVVATPGDQLWVTTSNRDGRGEPAERDDRILRVRP